MKDDTICPLWQVEAGDTERLRKARAVQKISVKQLKKGKYLSLTVSFHPDELENEEALFERLGPGFFELVGHDATGQIALRQRIQFEGRPRDPEGDAMTDDDDEPTRVPPASTAQPMPDPMAAMMGSMGPVGPLMMLMMQQGQQASAQNMTMMMEMSKQSNSLATAMISAIAGKSDIGAELLGKLLEHRQSNDPSQTFLAGANMVAEMTAGKREAEAAAVAASGDLDLTGAIKLVKEGFELFNLVKGQGGVSDSEAQRMALDKLGVPHE
jgi:hypothetical protein